MSRHWYHNIFYCGEATIRASLFFDLPRGGSRRQLLSPEDSSSSSESGGDGGSGSGGGGGATTMAMEGILAKLTDVIEVIEAGGGEVYDDYVATTRHPGDVLFVAALCISAISIVGMPLVVRLGRCLLLLRATTTTTTGGGRLQLHNDDNDDAQQSHDDPRSHLDYLWKIIRFDDETRRILRLCGPMICSANARHASALLTVALISHHLGTDEMLAYSMVYTILGITTSFLLGWIETIDSVASMAYGAGNCELTGRYVRTSCMCYVLSVIPTLLLWEGTLGRIMRLLGFDGKVSNLAHGIVLVHMAHDAVDGLSTGVEKFLAVIEREAYSNAVSCLRCVASVALLALTLARGWTTSLNGLCVVMLVNSALFLVICDVLIPLKLGWFTKYESGLFGTTNLLRRCGGGGGGSTDGDGGGRTSASAVVRDVYDAALPLAFGRLLEEAEWEVLTVFAATLGPAEAATWATMAFIWDFFESTTAAIGDASEMRVAYQLGKGRPGMAKLAGYKSMFVALLLSVLLSASFLCLNNALPSVLTRDTTIQRMLLDLFPLIALSNVSMTVGMVAWTVVGGQGRYDLATNIAIACSCFVTFPIAGGE